MRGRGQVAKARGAHGARARGTKELAHPYRCPFLAPALPASSGGDDDATDDATDDASVSAASSPSSATASLPHHKGTTPRPSTATVRQASAFAALGRAGRRWARARAHLLLSRSLLPDDDFDRVSRPGTLMLAGWVGGRSAIPVRLPTLTCGVREKKKICTP